jgi:uncharacterized protein YkwD
VITSAISRWLAVGLSVAALVLGTELQSVDAASPAEQESLVALVNAERASHGLAPLAAERRLTSAAEAYAGYMASANFFSHTGADGSVMRDRNEAHGYVGWLFMGENLAAGQSTPDRVVQAWMTSPGHRANVLSDQACEIGIGHAYSGGSRYKHYWAMEIGC